jgi:hypothetical protein
MSKDDVRQDDLMIHGDSPSDEIKVKVADDVFIIVTQAFCPKGHNLVGHGESSFDGYKGICLKLSDGKTEGLLEVSPFHGDLLSGMRC